MTAQSQTIFSYLWHQIVLGSLPGFSCPLGTYGGRRLESVCWAANSGNLQLFGTMVHGQRAILLDGFSVRTTRCFQPPFLTVLDIAELRFYVYRNSRHGFDVSHAFLFFFFFFWPFLTDLAKMCLP